MIRIITSGPRSPTVPHWTAVETPGKVLLMKIPLMKNHRVCLQAHMVGINLTVGLYQIQRICLIRSVGTSIQGYQQTHLCWTWRFLLYPLHRIRRWELLLQTRCQKLQVSCQTLRTCSDGSTTTVESVHGCLNIISTGGEFQRMNMVFIVTM